LISKVRASSPKVAVTFIKCDIFSLASVKTAAEALKTQTDHLDILMLNAGIMCVHPGASVEGYEIQFATNYLGHTLLVKLLLPLLLSTAEKPESDVRVINMTSLAYTAAPSEGIVFSSLKSPQKNLTLLVPGGKWSRYGQSKLAQMLYSQELAKRYPSLTSVSVHPGVINTGLVTNLGLYDRRPFILGAGGPTIPVEQGHWNQVWAAAGTKKDGLVNGGYYEPVGKLVPVKKRKTSASRDEASAGRL
jgi:NAD(P)-dependent dehydrogenase (short-subunit alcohol dehydrogenase family)